MELGKTYQNNHVNLGIRDAVHHNCVLVTCDSDTEACESMEFVDNTFKKVKPAKNVTHCKVDPFIVGKIKAGKAFWVLVNPKYTKGLVHVFQLFIPGLPDSFKPTDDIIKYDSDGYDSEGYDVNGYNVDGYDRSGYNVDGYDEGGCSRNCG